MRLHDLARRFLKRLATEALNQARPYRCAKQGLSTMAAMDGLRTASVATVSYFIADHTLSQARHADYLVTHALTDQRSQVLSLQVIKGSAATVSCGTGFTVSSRWGHPVEFLRRRNSTGGEPAR